jgi:hypothetical protein
VRVPLGESFGPRPRRESFAISQHSKNLLEAFKHSNPPPPTPATPTPKPVERAAPSSTPTPVVVASATPAPAAPARQAAPANPGSSLPRRPNLPRFASPIALIVAAQVVLLAVAFFIGRWSKGSFGDGVEAKGAGDRASLESALGSGAESPGLASDASASDSAGLLARPQKMSAADSALLDSRNRYTVKAIQYDANERNLALAKEVCAHFARRSLPVCTPYQRGGSLSILVGAAPNTADLEELQRAVKSIDSPNGAKGDFASAYIAPIDSVVQRNP